MSGKENWGSNVNGLSADPPKQDGNEAKGGQSLPRRQPEDL